ncbi:hypothetical protein DPMN_040880 [Dreissena polymorpha]|uniref:Uncharacterized protein n=1 Tax=Dreissena polymorpha TaxID=45954 RepID=A0A9D4HTG7_DREPO|nr:hypothetical protein DPMN_040880 [Dreissena polymorpha]
MSLGLWEPSKAVFGSFKLPCGSVTIQEDGSIREMIQYGPCSCSRGSGDSCIYALVICVHP